jgi:tRNA A-37 threonylcarbamoyl transferase component Bud32
MKRPLHEKFIEGFHWFSDNEKILVDLPSILSHPERKELKKNKYRSIYQISTPKRKILKIFEDPRFTQKVKERLSASHAGKEWAASKQLTKIGVGTIQGIAFGEKWEGKWVKSSVLLMEEVQKAKSLADILADRGLPQSRMNLLIEKLAEVVHRMHQAGICHRDLHGNNILVSGNELHILDLSTIWYLSWFPERAKEKNLEKLVQTFHIAGRSTSALRFCKRYLERAQSKESYRGFYRRIKKGSQNRLQKHYASQTQRALKSGSQFTIVEKSPFRIKRAGVLFDALLKGKSSFQNNAPVDIPTDRGSVSGWTKEYAHPSRARAKSRRGWMGLRALEVRGIPAPKGYAWIEALHGESSWIVMEKIEGAQPLGKWFRAEGDKIPASDRHRLTRDLAQFVKLIHANGIYHNDYSPKNFLVGKKEGQWMIHIVDPESVQLSRSLTQRRKIRNLSQIADLGKSVSRSDRLRFLLSYLGDFPREKWEPIARRIWRETNRRISARISRTGQSEPTEP